MRAAAAEATCQSAEDAGGRPGGQMTGAERSLVTVGRSRTVANGFPPLWRNGWHGEWRADVLGGEKRRRRSAEGDLRQESRRRSGGAVGLSRLGTQEQNQEDT